VNEKNLGFTPPSATKLTAHVRNICEVATEDEFMDYIEDEE